MTRIVATFIIICAFIFALNPVQSWSSTRQPQTSRYIMKEVQQRVSLFESRLERLPSLADQNTSHQLRARVRTAKAMAESLASHGTAPDDLTAVRRIHNELNQAQRHWLRLINPGIIHSSSAQAPLSDVEKTWVIRVPTIETQIRELEQSLSRSMPDGTLEHVSLFHIIKNIEHSLHKNSGTEHHSLNQTETAFLRTQSKTLSSRFAPHTTAEQRLETLRDYFFNDHMYVHYEHSSSLTDLLAGTGANGVARMNLILAALVGAANELVPDGYTIAVQVFRDHTRTVLFNEDTGIIRDVITGEEDTEVYGALFKPAIILHSILKNLKRRGYSVNLAFSEADFLIEREDGAHSASETHEDTIQSKVDPITVIMDLPNESTEYFDKEQPEFSLSSTPERHTPEIIIPQHKATPGNPLAIP